MTTSGLVNVVKYFAGLSICLTYVILSSCQSYTGVVADNRIDPDAIVQRVDEIAPRGRMTVVAVYSGRSSDGNAIVDVAARDGSADDYESLAIRLRTAAIRWPERAFVLVCEDGTQAKIVSQDAPVSKVKIYVSKQPDAIINRNGNCVHVFRVRLEVDINDKQIVSARLLQSFLGDSLYCPDAWPK